jgi:hypothetical protein
LRHDYAGWTQAKLFVDKKIQPLQSKRNFAEPLLTLAPTLEDRIMLNRLATCRHVALALLLGTAIAANAEDTLQAHLTKLGYRQADAVDKVQNYRVDGWNYIDSKHIVIYAGPGQRYLIGTMNDCSDLSSAENIGFTSTVNYLTKFDKLIVRGPGGFVRNCPITEINRLESIKK